MDNVQTQTSCIMCCHHEPLQSVYHVTSSPANKTNISVQGFNRLLYVTGCIEPHHIH
jgi:hypothetical protein